MDNIENKFKSIQEEISFLRESLEKKKINENTPLESFEKEEEIKKQLEGYKQVEPEKILDKEYQISDVEINKKVISLNEGDDDKILSDLLLIVDKEGIKNALSVASKMGDPYLEDDFHKILVKKIKDYKIKKSKKRKIIKELEMTLFEVVLPDSLKMGDAKDIQSIIAPMEQFYSGMLSISDKENLGYFSLEIANSNKSKDLIIYAAIPNDKIDLFEKQIFSIFPDAIIKEQKDDFNIFRENYFVKGTEAFLEKRPFFSLKKYDSFSVDPIGIVLNSFSKLTEEEGAAVQFVLDTRKNSFNSKFQKGVNKLKSGQSIDKAFGSGFLILDFISGLLNFFIGSKKNKEVLGKNIDQNVIDNIQEKISDSILPVNIRIVVSAKDEVRSGLILNDLKAAFNQFESPQGNRIIFLDLKKRKLKKMLHNFSFRIFDKKRSLLLNIKELSTIFHFPMTEVKSTNILKQSSHKTASISANSKKQGVLLGINKHRGIDNEVYFDKEDRLRHFYVIGQTGTGKTTLLKNMVYQDIVNGEGVCMIDPHGADIEDILGVIPKERYDDVIYFDPSDVSKPMSINMLEYDRKHPEQKTFVVNEMLSIFNKLFDMKAAGGPMFEQYFRQSVLLTIDHPESGNTLADVSRVLSDKSFRDMKLSHCKNETVLRFWKEIAEKAEGEASLQNIVPYITSKFDVFLSNDIMAPIVSKPKSTFNFREIMDNKKILLVNLSKGQLGELNSNLIGLIIVGKILMAALSRTDLKSEEMSPFYLYIDEFQNVTTDSISVILSEARKYKLSLNIAHQFIKQIDTKIRDSVFGNVGSIAVFRTGMEDAEFLEKQFSPTFDAKDIANLENRNAYLKMLVKGQPVKPFNLETIAPKKGDHFKFKKLKELSYLNYGFLDKK